MSAYRERAILRHILRVVPRLLRAHPNRTFDVEKEIVPLLLKGLPHDSPETIRRILQITLEDNQLVIRGRQADDGHGRVFLHRGIAARQFQRAFVIAEGIEVKGAWLDNGLLHVDLVRPVPQPVVKTIPISRGQAKTSVAPTRTVEGDSQLSEG